MSPDAGGNILDKALCSYGHAVPHASRPMLLRVVLNTVRVSETGKPT